MKKGSIAVIVICIIGVVLLIAAGIYTRRSQKKTDAMYSETGHTDESEPLFRIQEATESAKKTQDDTIGSTGQTSDGAGQSSVSSGQTDGSPNEKIQSESETGQTGSLSNGNVSAAFSSEGPLPTHRIIWVGDSRTLGMKNALGKMERADDDIFVGKVGEGEKWFREEGMHEMDEAIHSNPDLPVVLNLGVNDPEEISNYIVTYWNCLKKYPDTDFYIMSVNPVDEEMLIAEDIVTDEVLGRINNLTIARMNVRLKDEFESEHNYIDVSSYLRQTGFATADGIHFTTDTYLKIHDYVVRFLFS